MIIFLIYFLNCRLFLRNYRDKLPVSSYYLNLENPDNVCDIRPKKKKLHRFEVINSLDEWNSIWNSEEFYILTVDSFLNDKLMFVLKMSGVELQEKWTWTNISTKNYTPQTSELFSFFLDGGNRNKNYRFPNFFASCSRILIDDTYLLCFYLKKMAYDCFIDVCVKLYDTYFLLAPSLNWEEKTCIKLFCVSLFRTAYSIDVWHINVSIFLHNLVQINTNCH